MVSLKKYSPFILISFIFIVAFLALNEGLKFGCYNALDYSIYQQAAYDIIEKGELNPFLSIRKIRIFNDHFNPILYIASVFSYFTAHHYASLLWFEFLTFLSFVAVVLYFIRDRSTREKLFYLILITFTKAFWGPLHFPVHPTTWAILPIFLTTYYLIKERYNLALIFALSTLLYRESYPFTLFSCSFFFLFKKDYRNFLKWFIPGTLGTLFTFIFWEKLTGPIQGYGHVILENLLQNPIQYTLDLFKNFHYKAFFKLFYPFLIPLFFLKNRKMIPVIFYSLPLVALHFIANAFSYHHSAQFGAVLFAIMFGLDLYKHVSLKKVKYLILILFILSGMSSHSKFFKYYFMKDNQCIVNKKEDNKVLDTYSRKIPKGDNVLSTGGVIPFFLKPEMKIFQLKGYSGIIPNYQWLLLERNTSANTFPVSSDEVETIIKNCKKFADETILNNEYYYFSIGNFPYSCIEEVNSQSMEFKDYDFK